MKLRQTTFFRIIRDFFNHMTLKKVMFISNFLLGGVDGDYYAPHLFFRTVREKSPVTWLPITIGLSDLSYEECCRGKTFEVAWPSDRRSCFLLMSQCLREFRHLLITEVSFLASTTAFEQ
jgi:hypothetical protein